MRLVSVRIRMFKHITDTGNVNIDRYITRLVGKNESGKTAILEAIRRLNPAEGRNVINFDRLLDYPAWREKEDERKSEDSNQETYPISAVFEISKTENEKIESEFGNGILKSNKITISVNYNNKHFWSIDYNESKLEEIEKEWQDLCNKLGEFLPTFFYFNNYDIIEEKCILQDVIDNQSVKSPGLKIWQNLLKEVNFRKDFVMGGNDFLRAIRELENIANDITDTILDYWKTNDRLNVNIHHNKKIDINTNQELIEIYFMIYDSLHRHSQSFKNRSSGFCWFFSFLAAFQAFKYNKTPVILLLDEPALYLHAKAQQDFLRFLNEKLSTEHQIIFTTHSPFMIETDQRQMDQIRLIQDNGPKKGGVVVSDNPYDMGPDTVFPLKSSIGFELSQILLKNRNNLVVEGMSDRIYLELFSQQLRDKGREHLKHDWNIIPIGSADKIPSWVSSIGDIKTNVTVLFDSEDENKKMKTQIDKGIISDKNVIMVGEIINKSPVDIEDLFDVDDYLNLYNKSFEKSVKLDKSGVDDRIVSRISKAVGKKFNHNTPAKYLSENQEIIKKLSSETLNNFEKLIKKINITVLK